ncbi:MAG: histidinol-phosphate transaminase [Pseudomonadota bacterium]
MTRIQPQPGILGITPYVGGKGAPTAQANSVKLSSNENPHGASPRARDAYRAMSGNLHIYPSGDHRDLRAAIGSVHDVDPDRIVCGSGSDEILALLCNAYTGPGTQIVQTAHAFAMYAIYARAAGAEVVSVPENARHADVDALLAAVTDTTRLVFLANPNNPTGTMIPDADVAHLAEALPDSCLLVLDGAYAEYVPGHDGYLGLAAQHDHVFVTRTFSKIHGLGALRVGWGIGTPEVIGVLNRIRGPFNVTAPALSAAQAAIEHTDYVDRCRDDNTRWRDWLVGELHALGLACDPMHGNFVVPRFADAAAAQAADAALAEAGLIVRQVGGYGLPEALRITVGKGADCKRVIAVLKEHLA